jgi:hypothetical protein
MPPDTCELKHESFKQELENLKKDFLEVKAKQVLMSESQVKTGVQLDMVITTLNSLATKVDAINMAPAKRYNNLADEIVRYIIIAVLAFFASKLIN